MKVAVQVKCCPAGKQLCREGPVIPGGQQVKTSSQQCAFLRCIRKSIANKSGEMICTGEASSRVICPGLWVGMLGCTVQERQGALGESPGEGYKVDKGTRTSL